MSSLTTVTGSDAESWWQWLTDFPADMLVSVLPGAVVEVMTRLGELLPDCCLQAHAGNGLVRVQWPSREAEPPAAAGNGLAALLRDKLPPGAGRISAASSLCSPPPVTVNWAVTMSGARPARPPPSCGP